MSQEMLAEAQKQIDALTQTTDAQAAEIARLREANLLREAAAIVTETISGVTSPVPTRAWLTAALALDPPLKDGGIDREALVTKVTEATTGGAGRIVGMGGTVPAAETVPTLEESETRIKAALAGL